MKKTGLALLVLGIAIASLIVGLRAITAQPDESTPQDIAQNETLPGDPPEDAPPRGERPEGGPSEGERPARPQEDLGEPIASTEIDTTGVLCNVNESAVNDQLELASEVQWSCEDGQRRLVANGVPNHRTGEQFLTERNPIMENEVSAVMPLNPVARTGTGQRMIVPAYALNGVKFNPGTGGRCASDITDASECSLRPGSTGEWTMEALGQSSFDFGEDANHAHVQREGEYHYHGVPEGMLSEQNVAGEAMQLIGWAVDGFPLYARFGYSDADASTSDLRIMESSYQLKTAPDPNRPSVDLLPMGTFSQDYEYIEGSGDLDECNGRFAVTPEFPQGVYHYYTTDVYPFVQRCVKGTPDPSLRSGPGGGPGGGSGGDPGGAGGDGPRPGGPRPGGSI